MEKDEFGRMTFLIRFSNAVADMKCLLKKYPEAAFDMGFGTTWEAAPVKVEDPVAPLNMTPTDVTNDNMSEDDCEGPAVAENEEM